MFLNLNTSNINLRKVKMSSNISFIMPAYNCAKTISLSLDSIINGNLGIGDEIVIVDDGSGDDTLKIISNYADRYDCIRIVQHELNQGGSAARNTAVKNSIHDLVFCLDSDNLLIPGSVEKLKTCMVEQNVDAVAFQECIFFIESLGGWTHKWVFRPGFVELADCLASDIVPIASGNYLYTKESWIDVGGYPGSVGALDAWGFGFYQIAKEHRIYVLENTGYYHKYGYDSYFIRDSKAGNINKNALRLVEPFFDKLDEQSLKFIKSTDGRSVWLKNRYYYPLKTKDGKVGQGGWIEYRQVKCSYMRKIFSSLKKIIRKIVS